MDFANRGNRPNQAQNSQSPQNDQPAPAFQAPAKKSSRGGFDLSKVSAIFVLVTGALLAAVVVAALVFINGNSEKDLIKTDKYQAVFLDSADGQVYFGQLDVYNDDLYTLSDIFYVRVQQPIQPEGENQQAQPNISLAKLGSELHGPEDFMFIQKDKVLYWENLKDDGQVVSAIVDYYENGGEEGQQAQQQQAQQQAAQQQQQATQPAGTDPVDDTAGDSAQ